MSDLRYLVQFLAATHQIKTTVPEKRVVKFDERFIQNNFFLQAEDNTTYGAVEGYYVMTVVLPDNQSLWYKETADDYEFYVKRVTTENGTTLEEFHKLYSYSHLGFTFAPLNDTSDLEAISVASDTFKYSTDLNTLYFSYEILGTAVLDGNQDTFYYKRALLSKLESGEHELNYKDSLGLYNDILDNSVRKAKETYVNVKQRTVTLELEEDEEGRVFKFPAMSHANVLARKMVLDYNFDNDEPVIASKFLNENYAIRIEFNSYQAYFAFCNQVYFSRNVSFDLDIRAKEEREFYESYHYIVRFLIEDAARSSQSLRDLIDILWYIPKTYIQAQIGVDFLWDLLIRMIEEDDINNLGINKEDVVLKILKNIRKMLNPDDFLTLMLLKLANGKDAAFFKLFKNLNTDEFKTFVTMFWNSWIQSSYSKLDPKQNPVLPENKEKAAPLVLPYTSDQTLGFYHTNATIDFAENQIHLEVQLQVDTGETVTAGSRPKTAETTNVYNYYNYNYHVFQPVVIMNTENPGFIYHKSEGRRFTILPAFVLLANEESAFWENIKTGAEYTLDIVTTFSGFGNLAKFRHLSKLAKLGHKLSLLQKAKRAVTGFAAITEISSGSINALLKLSGLKNTKFGQSLSEVLFYLELLSLGGEMTLAIRKGLQKSAKEVLSNKDVLIKNLDELIETKKITQDDKFKFLNEIDLLSREIKVAGPGGKGFLGGQRLGRSEIRTWIKYIEEISDGKASLKIVEEGDTLYNSLVRENAQAGFNPYTLEIVVRKGFTEFEIFHEVKHLEEYFILGRENYLRGMVKHGGTFEEDLIRQYKRELYVYNRVIENSHKFNKAELKKSKRIISHIESKLKRNKIDFSNIKID